MNSLYAPDEVEFCGGPLDGQVKKFADVGWCRLWGTAPDCIYVWRDDLDLQKALKGWKVKRVRLQYVDEGSMAHASTVAYRR